MGHAACKALAERIGGRLPTHREVLDQMWFMDEHQLKLSRLFDEDMWFPIEEDDGTRQWVIVGEEKVSGKLGACISSANDSDESEKLNLIPERMYFGVVLPSTEGTCSRCQSVTVSDVLWNSYFFCSICKYLIDSEAESKQQCMINWWTCANREHQHNFCFICCPPKRTPEPIVESSSTTGVSQPIHNCTFSEVSDDDVDIVSFDVAIAKGLDATGVFGFVYDPRRNIYKLGMGSLVPSTHATVAFVFMHSANDVKQAVQQDCASAAAYYGVELSIHQACASGLLELVQKQVEKESADPNSLDEVMP